MSNIFRGTELYMLDQYCKKLGEDIDINLKKVLYIWTIGNLINTVYKYINCKNDNLQNIINEMMDIKNKKNIDLNSLYIYRIKIKCVIKKNEIIQS